jgi:hypothetical protein
VSDATGVTPVDELVSSAGVEESFFPQPTNRVAIIVITTTTDNNLEIIFFIKISSFFITD